MRLSYGSESARHNRTGVIHWVSELKNYGAACKTRTCERRITKSGSIHAKPNINGLKGEDQRIGTVSGEQKENLSFKNLTSYNSSTPTTYGFQTPDLPECEIVSVFQRYVMKRPARKNPLDRKKG